MVVSLIQQCLWNQARTTSEEKAFLIAQILISRHRTQRIKLATSESTGRNVNFFERVTVILQTTTDNRVYYCPDLHEFNNLKAMNIS